MNERLRLLIVHMTRLAMRLSEEKWYSRTVFSVANIEESLAHYCKKLGFTQSWEYAERGVCIVTQVARGELEIILAANLDQIGGGRIFISLSTDEMKRFQVEIEEGELSIERIHWGYPSIQIQDPDGNKMILPVEAEP